MALSPSNLPSLYQAVATNSANTAFTQVLITGLTSGFTVSYLDTTAWSPKNFPVSTYDWADVQRIINWGYDFYNLPGVTLINANILKLALRQGYITLPKSYRSGQLPHESN